MSNPFAGVEARAGATATLNRFGKQEKNMPKTPEADLVTIGNGAALELFKREMARVLANIKDPNTSPTKARSIGLTFSFKPYNDRSGAAIEIEVKSRICATTGVNATIYIQRIGGGAFEAYTQDNRQEGFSFDKREDEELAQAPTPTTARQ